MADPGTYRTKEEVDREKQRDPLVTFRDHLMAEAVIKESDWKALEKEVRTTVEEAVRYAKQRGRNRVEAQAPPWARAASD